MFYDNKILIFWKHIYPVWLHTHLIIFIDLPTLNSLWWPLPQYISWDQCSCSIQAISRCLIFLDRWSDIWKIFRTIIYWNVWKIVIWHCCCESGKIGIINWTFQCPARILSELSSEDLWVKTKSTIYDIICNITYIWNFSKEAALVRIYFSRGVDRALIQARWICTVLQYDVSCFRRAKNLEDHLNLSNRG